MDILDLDLETRSECDLRKCGVYRYAEHPTTQITLFSYSYNLAPVQVWDLTDPNTPSMPADLRCALKACHIIYAHNSQFDRVVIEHLYPEWIAGKRWSDTMVLAYLHALPGALKQLSAVFNLKEKGKMEGGRDLVNFFCKPHKKGEKRVWNDRTTHPKEWAEFVRYAGRDILAMQEVRRLCPKWNTTQTERQLWDMDQRMNARGFQVDVDLAAACVELLNEEKQERDAATQSATDGDVRSATQRDAMLKFILETYGVTLPDLTKATIERRIDDPDLPEEVKELLRLRLLSASTSGKKWKTLLDTVCSDGRLRGTMQFGAAFRTMRWGGRLFQPQNLPRPTVPDYQVEGAIEAILRRDREWLRMMHGSYVDVASSALRGALIAGPGKKIISADLKAIEGRALAYLAGEEWKLQAYRDNDAGMGHDLYIMAYAKAFNIDPDDVTKDMRQIGKVIELALGYQGGVGAFVTFSLAYGINLDELAVKAELPDWAAEEAESFYWFLEKKGNLPNLDQGTFIFCDAVKRMWRKSNPKIERFWYDLDAAFVSAVLTGKVSKVGKLVISRQGKWVCMQLPSGRCINYPGARVEDDIKTYLGVNTYSRKWCRMKTYGGKLSENATQAFSRDVFAHGVYNAEKHGYLPVLLVHDDDVTEVPDTKDYTIDGLVEHLCAPVSWAPGLPLNADGFEAYRYRK